MGSSPRCGIIDAGNMYRLLFQNRALPKEPLVVDLPSVVIGRHGDCHVQIAEPGVSERHATIEQQPDGYYVRSLDDISGVRVNGEAVTELRLASGDELEVGPAHLRFEIIHSASPKQQRRRIDLLQVLATLVVLATIVGEIVMLSTMFSESRPNRVKLEALRAPPTDQTGTQTAGSAASAVPAPVAPHPTTVVSPPTEPAVLNHMIRIVRADRNDSGDTVNITIQTKAQVGERELDAPSVSICAQFAAVDGAGLGVDWRSPMWLQIPAWENFS